MFPAYRFISVTCLAVYAKKKRNDEKIDMKALSSNECVILTLIMIWLFEKCDTIILGYWSMRSLISLKVCAQFWVYRLCRRILAMSPFCDWNRSIEDCDVIKCYRKLPISQIAVLYDRRSPDRKIARFSLYHSVLLMRHCDVRHRISAVGDSLGFPFLSAFNARDAMGSRVALFQCIYALRENADRKSVV